MIAMLRGRLVYSKEDYLVLDVQGVGYKVYAPVSLLAGSIQEITLHTYLQVREDAMVLYGFPQLAQLELFELLITVSGMGPRGALAVLSHLDTDRVRQAVLSEDLAALTRIPGVGKKTAQRLVLELKDKLKPAADNEPAALAGPAQLAADQAQDALIALGYSAVEAKKAVTAAGRNAGENLRVEDLIKLALKHLL